MAESELCEFLGLWMRPDCEHRQWCVQGSVMHDHGRGVDHGMKWLYMALAQKQTRKWSSTVREVVAPENIREEVTAVKRDAKVPAVRPADAAQSSPGRARMHSTAESIVEGSEEEGSEDEDQGDGERGSSLDPEERSKFVQTLFASVPLLQHLDEAARAKLAEGVTTKDIAAGIPIVVEGETGNVMFFVEKGQANAVVEGEIVKQYTRGEFFGELALSDEGTVRAATVL